MAKIFLAAFHNETCVGLRYLKSYLESNGHCTVLVVLKIYSKTSVDQVPEPPGYTEVHEVFTPEGWSYLSYPWPPTETEWNLWTEQLRLAEPDLVCMSLAASHVRTAISATQRIRQEMPDVPVVWGGPQPTLSPEDALKHADYVCLGEGEKCVLDMANAIDHGREVNSVNNLAYLDEEGSLFINPLHPHIKELDELPFPDYDPQTCLYIELDQLYRGDFPPESEHKGSYMLFTTRGCPFDCSYCINSTYSGLYKGFPRVRRRSVQNVIEELREVKQRWGNIFIQIFDEIFTLDQRRIIEFCDAYKKEIQLPFWCYTHPGCCNEEAATALRAAGLRYIVLGIQSGSERMNREVYHRKTRNRQILETIRLLDRLNVITFCDLMTNNPLETEEDRRCTAELLRECPDRIALGMGKLVIYPKTPLQDFVRDMDFPPPVDEKLYRYWNSVYVLALHGNLSETEWIDLIDNSELREHPEELENKARDCAKTAAAKTYQRSLDREEEVREQLHGPQHNGSRTGWNLRRAFGWVSRLIRSR